MANTLKPKRTYTTSNVPSNLSAGELAVNAADGKVWIGNESGDGNVLISSLSFSDMLGNTDNIFQGNTNRYYDDLLARAAISSSVDGLTYTLETGVFSLTSGYSIPTTESQTTWDTAYSERRQWDGSSTNLVAATGRTSLGLENVENTALSTWTGSINLTTLGNATSKNLVITDSSTGVISSSYNTFKVSITGSKFNSLSSTTADVYFDLNRTITNSAVGGLGPYYSQIGIRVTPPNYTGGNQGFSTSKYPVTMQIDSAPTGITTTGIATSLSLFTGYANGRALVIQGATNQYDGGSNLMEVYDSNYNLIFIINPRGYTTVSGGLIVNAAVSQNMFYPAESGSIKLKGINSNFNSVGFKAPNTFSSSVLWTLPSADGTSGQVLATNGSGTLSWITNTSGSGTVTSVGLSLPAIFSVTNSPVTTSGTLTASLATQTANTVLAGPTTGVAAAPTFRSLVASDIPTLNQNTTGTASNVTGTVAIANGGTGQTTATAAFNALAPSQASNSGKYLKTDGTNTSWATVTAGPVFTVSATAPVSPTQGDQWFDTDTGFLYQYINDGNTSQWIQIGGNTLTTGVPAGGTTNQFLVKGSNSDYNVTWSSTLNNPTILNYTETIFSPAANSAFTVDLTNGTIQKFTTNANTTITLPSSISGKSFVLIVAYGGAHTITWAGGSTIKWPGGTAPTVTSVLNKIDIFSFFQDGTNTYGTSFGLNL